MLMALHLQFLLKEKKKKLSSFIIFSLLFFFYISREEGTPLDIEFQGVIITDEERARTCRNDL